MGWSILEKIRRATVRPKLKEAYRGRLPIIERYVIPGRERTAVKISEHGTVPYTSTLQDFIRGRRRPTIEGRVYPPGRGVSGEEDFLSPSSQDRILTTVDIIGDNPRNRAVIEGDMNVRRDLFQSSLNEVDSELSWLRSIEPAARTAEQAGRRRRLSQQRDMLILDLNDIEWSLRDLIRSGENQRRLDTLAYDAADLGSSRPIIEGTTRMQRESGFERPGGVLTVDPSTTLSTDNLRRLAAYHAKRGEANSYMPDKIVEGTVGGLHHSDFIRENTRRKDLGLDLSGAKSRQEKRDIARSHGWEMVGAETKKGLPRKSYNIESRRYPPVAVNPSGRLFQNIETGYVYAPIRSRRINPIGRIAAGRYLRRLAEGGEPRVDIDDYIDRVLERRRPKTITLF